jgi:hypothetical protein
MEDIADRMQRLELVSQLSRGICDVLATIGCKPQIWSIPTAQRPQLLLSSPQLDLEGYALNHDMAERLQDAFAIAGLQLEKGFTTEYDKMLDKWAGPSDHLLQLADVFETHFRASANSIRELFYAAIERYYAEQACKEANAPLKVGWFTGPPKSKDLL